MANEHGASPLWSPRQPADTAMARFAKTIFGQASSVEGLHDWSTSEPGAFWSAVWQHCGVIGDPGLRPIDAQTFMPSTRFFPDASLSVVENLLRRSGSTEAVVAIDERGVRRSRTWDELRRRT